MTTPQGVALANQHRVAQTQIALVTAQQMIRVWPLLVRGGTIDANVPTWLEVATAVIAAQRARSAAAAVSFLAAYRMAETGTLEDFTPPVPAVDLTLEAVRTSLSVLGPTAYKREVARQIHVEPRDLTPVDLAFRPLPSGLNQKLAANTARAAIRHVQNGARDTTDEVLRSDRKVVGYMRTTGAHPCWFCAMLASRGPVYEQDSFSGSDPRFHGPGHQKVHDGCGCMLLPMYRRMESPDELGNLSRYKEFDALWRANNSALAFRRAYEGR